jgi:hypothetical protein
MSLAITLVPPPPGPRIYRHRFFRRNRDFGRKTYRRRRMGGPRGETYIIAERAVVFPPEDYCHCNGNAPGCIPGTAPCDFNASGFRQVDTSGSAPKIRVARTDTTSIGQAEPPSPLKTFVVVGGSLAAIAVGVTLLRRDPHLKMRGFRGRS